MASKPGSAVSPEGSTGNRESPRKKSSEPGEKSQEPSATPEQEPKDRPTSEPISVTADRIVQEFGDNEFAADQKYKGQTLKITGVVEGIDTDLFDEDEYILSIGGGGSFELFTVDCYGMSTDELATLNKGDSVTVIGKFDDGGDLGVDVSGCSLV